MCERAVQTPTTGRDSSPRCAYGLRRNGRPRRSVMLIIASGILTTVICVQATVQ